MRQRFRNRQREIKRETKRVRGKRDKGAQRAASRGKEKLLNTCEGSKLARACLISIKVTIS